MRSTIEYLFTAGVLLGVWVIYFYLLFSPFMYPIECDCGEDDKLSFQHSKELLANNTHFYTSPFTNCTYELYESFSAQRSRSAVNCPDKYHKRSFDALFGFIGFGLSYGYRIFLPCAVMYIQDFSDHKANLEKIIKNIFDDAMDSIFITLTIMSFFLKSEAVCHNLFFTAAFSIKAFHLLISFFRYATNKRPNNSEIVDFAHFANELRTLRIKYSVVQGGLLILLITGFCLSLIEKNSAICNVAKACFFAVGGFSLIGARRFLKKIGNTEAKMGCSVLEGNTSAYFNDGHISSSNQYEQIPSNEESLLLQN